MSQENHKNLLIGILRQHPEGLTISSLAEISGLHRHTSRKYVNELIHAGSVAQRYVGAAKLCYLNSENCNAVAEKRSFFSRFSFKNMFLVVFITFLLSEAAIMGYQNESFNETISNLSNSSPITASMILNESNMSSVIEAAIDNASNGSVGSDSSAPDTLTNLSTDVNETVCTPLENEANESILNETQIIQNETIQNETQNVTNESANESILNETQIIQNETIQNVTNESTDNSSESVNNTFPLINETLHPEFSINIDYAQRITRGETFLVKVYVTNIGAVAARNVAASLRLPEGFSVVSTNSYQCSVVEPSQTCSSEITVSSTISASLGLADLKAVINYEG
jgi:hypothetical protein